MITLVAEHWIKPQFMDKTMEVFRVNSKKMKADGNCVSRLVLQSLSDPSKVTTVTTWESEAGYRAFLDELEQRRAQRDPAAPKALLGEKLEGYEVMVDA